LREITINLCGSAYIFLHCGGDLIFGTAQLS
jgi:hypothetical protein